ncbi:MAG: hypothetical protein KC729_21405, partial [Candidatus Eisenbacteria bacterium]|nr:hypothetical protein [Candidatus Eisenbacteria bacterium]
MVPRLYPRPFEKPTPLFRTHAAGGPPLAARILRLRRDYRRSLWVAVTLAVLAHGFAGYSLRNIDPLPQPEPIVGYVEGIEVIEIAAVAPDLPRDRKLAHPRPPSGALVAIDLATKESDPETPRPIDRSAPPAPRPPTPKMPVFEAPPPISELPEEPIRIELREDWSVDPASPEAAFSAQFQ